MGTFSCGYDLFSGEIAAVGDVGCDRIIKEEGFLRNKSNVFAQRFLRIGAQRFAIDANLSLLHFMQSRDQLNDGRFAGSCWANNGYSLPLKHSKTKIP